MTECNHFEGNDAIETFLARAKNYALSAAPNFFQQFVVAEVHQHRRRRKFDIFSAVGLDGTDTGLEQASSTQLLW